MPNNKCYLAGQISGIDYDTYKKNFEEASLFVKSLGLDPINPTELSHNHDKSWESYMKEDITELLKCDFIYALDGWEFSKGAVLEVQLAIKLKITLVKTGTKRI